MTYTVLNECPDSFFRFTSVYANAQVWFRDPAALTIKRCDGALESAMNYYYFLFFFVLRTQMVNLWRFDGAIHDSLTQLYTHVDVQYLFYFHFFLSTSEFICLLHFIFCDPTALVLPPITVTALLNLFFYADYSKNNNKNAPSLSWTSRCTIIIIIIIAVLLTTLYSTWTFNSHVRMFCVKEFMKVRWVDLWYSNSIIHAWCEGSMKKLYGNDLWNLCVFVTIGMLWK